MKTLPLIFAIGFALHAVGLAAATDYTELNKAVDNYFVTLDAITKKVATVNDAAGTAGILNDWAAATEGFANAGQHFIDAHPEVMAQPEPPPEFAAAFGRLSRMKTDYAPMTTAITGLLQKFHDDPDVTKAIVRFQKSLQKIQQAGAPQKK